MGGLPPSQTKEFGQPSRERALVGNKTKSLLGSCEASSTGSVALYETGQIQDQVAIRIVPGLNLCCELILGEPQDYPTCNTGIQIFAAGPLHAPLSCLPLP